MERPEDESREEGENHDEKERARQEELKKSVEAKLALRKSNLNPERPDAGSLRALDSSIKRNTAVIKKLKQISEEQRDSLMEDLKSVNLSKFVGEAVTAICDAKLKSSDIQAAVQICSLIHQRYKEFSPCLILGLLKVFFPGKSVDDLEADKNLRAMKKRSTLKLLLELYFVGVIEDSGIFINIVKDLTGLEYFKDRETTQTNLSLLTSFTRQGRTFLGLPLAGQEVFKVFFEGLNLTEEQRKYFRNALHTYYDAIAELLRSEHSSLRQMEHENAKILNAKGELSEENASSYEKLRKSYDHLYRGVSAFAEALEIESPVMPEDGRTTRLTSGEDTPSLNMGKDVSVIEAVWDDEDTRAFYECLPDLRAFVPAVLLGEAEPKTNDHSPKAQEQPSDSTSEPDQVQSSSDYLEIRTSQEGKSEDKDDKGNIKTKDFDKGKGKDKDVEKRGENEKEKIKGVEGTNFDSLLQRLPGCVSRDLIDQLTVEFCYINSKSTRKKLVRALFNVPRTSLELLPYYSRMVATLSTCMRDVSTMLLQLLEEEFNFLINKKDQINIESKIRNIRFIGELCKFKIAPSGLVFSYLKACLDDFTHHNIDVACTLLETCGRFLYRSPETSIRMSNMLEILMRLKNVKNLDPRHSTLVENAYYLCKPPERSARVSKVRPPLHQYIRKLLFSDLDKNSIEYVLRQLRKLPWSECESYLLKCFMKVQKGKYGQIHLLASLTAGLSRYHDDFAVAVVDELLEEIRVGLELNDYGMQQRRLAHMRLLGELYNYEQLESYVIFETLYLILVFGYGTPEQDFLDPPEDCFRIRIVITVLETCGHYFGRGSSKRKLDRFLIYFQRYLLSKGAIPLDIEFDLQDLFVDLRPNMKRYSSIEEVDAALIELEEYERNASTDKASNEKQSVNDKPRIGFVNVSANGQDLGNGSAENGTLNEITGDRDSDSDLGSDSNHEREDDLDEGIHDDVCDSEDEYGDVAHASDDEEEFRVRQKITRVDPKEEAEFDKELKALLQESLDSRKLELRVRPTLNMAMPMNVFEGQTRDHHHGRGLEGESGDDTLDEDTGGYADVKVKVLMKRGKQQHVRQMFIPRDCSLVQSTREKEAAELEEKQDIKRLVLEYNDREEEELNGLGQQPSGWVQSGGNRFYQRAHTTDGYGGRGGPGSRHRYPHNSGGGYYYSRRR